MIPGYTYMYMYMLSFDDVWLAYPPPPPIKRYWLNRETATSDLDGSVGRGPFNMWHYNYTIIQAVICQHVPWTAYDRRGLTPCSSHRDPAPVSPRMQIIIIIIIIIIKICSAHIHVSTLLGARGAETEKTWMQTIYSDSKNKIMRYMYNAITNIHHLWKIVT